MQVSFYDKVANVGKGAVEGADYLFSNTEALAKVSAFALAILGLVGTVLTHFVPGSGAALEVISKLKQGPEGVKALTGATGIIGRVHEFADSAERKKISSTWQKFTSRVALTGGQSLETVSFLHSVSLVEVGALGLNVAGNLTILAAAKNAFIAISSVFSIWDASKKIHEEKHSTAATKLREWQTDKTDRMRHADKYVVDVDLNAVVGYKINKYTHKTENSLKIVKKSWVTIAAEASKIAIISLASLAALFMLSTATALLVVGVTAVVASSIGLGKTLYDKFGPELVKVPNNPFKLVQ